MPRPPHVDELIAQLGLAPLPHEGGFFRVTARTTHVSAITFLLTADDFSALHRLAQDELWHFQAGDPVEHVQFDAAGRLQTTRLGCDLGAGDSLQALVPAGHWQGARLAGAGAHGYALVACTVAPPWDERGFELGDRAALRRMHPEHARWIHALTR